MTVRASGVGSLPGTEFIEAARTVIGLFDGHLPFVPELPDRGVHAGMIGRTLGLVPMPIDIQPAGWRIALGEGVDQRRARSLLARDLDEFEEVAHEYAGQVKQQVVGPLTLAATVEKTRGDKVLSDHGARRDLAEALAHGVGEHVAELRRRVAGDVVIQVDEPALTAVLGGGVPTASGFGRHRSVHAPEADAHLRLLVDAITDAGARAVVHSCADEVPVSLLAGAGFSAISFDLSLARPDDAWAEALEAGVDLWPGATDPRAIERFLGQLGFATDAVDLVVTPACGLAGSDNARRVLDAAISAAQSLR